MKKTINLKSYLITLSVISILIISSCKKNSDSFKNLTGTWISTDLIDTVEFRTDSDFYKIIGIQEVHYKYRTYGDSLTIQYNGPLFIYELPSNHYYKISSDILTIDFRKCYGFRNQVITFSKK